MGEGSWRLTVRNISKDLYFKLPTVYHDLTYTVKEHSPHDCQYEKKFDFNKMEEENFHCYIFYGK